MKPIRDIVFIDMSIYFAENFFCANNRISQLAKLVNIGILSLVTTDITNCEIVKNLVEQTLPAIQRMRRENRHLSNYAAFKHYFAKTYADMVTKEAQQLLNDFLDKGKVMTIGYGYCKML